MKVIISGSAKLPGAIELWVQYWNSQSGHTVIDHPKTIPPTNFDELYPEVFKSFFRNIAKADILFVANEPKNSIGGYIGAGTFAELSFGLAQKLIHGQNIQLVLAHLPDEQVPCHDEIIRWLKLGWIEILA